MKVVLVGKYGKVTIPIKERLVKNLIGLGKNIPMKQKKKYQNQKLVKNFLKKLKIK